MSRVLKCENHLAGVRVPATTRSSDIEDDDVMLATMTAVICELQSIHYEAENADLFPGDLQGLLLQILRGLAWQVCVVVEYDARPRCAACVSPSPVT